MAHEPVKENKVEKQTEDTEVEVVWDTYDPVEFEGDVEDPFEGGELDEEIEKYLAKTQPTYQKASSLPQTKLQKRLFARKRSHDFLEFFCEMSAKRVKLSTDKSSDGNEDERVEGTIDESVSTQEKKEEVIHKKEEQSEKKDKKD